jgi:hypothetical protein
MWDDKNLDFILLEERDYAGSLQTPAPLGQVWLLLGPQGIITLKNARG